MTIQSSVSTPAPKPSNAGPSVASKAQTPQAQPDVDLGASGESDFSGILMSMGEERQVDSPAGEPLKAPVDFQQQLIVQDPLTPAWVLNPLEQPNTAKALLESESVAIKVDGSAAASSVPSVSFSAPAPAPAPLLKPAPVPNSVSSLALPTVDPSTLVEDGASQGLSKQFSKSIGLAKLTTGQMVEAKDFKTHQLLDFSQLMRQQTEVVSVAAAKESDVFKIDRANEKLSVKSFASGAEGNTAYQTPVGTTRSDAVSATYSVSSLSPEMVVAEQVSYWITQDVQRAELKLDGPGQDPVEVTIFVRGNEASVEFRSDQAETRQVLESAVAHLKDLLRGEGMVLSGVSVGASGHNGAGTKQQQNRREAHFSTGEDVGLTKVSLHRADRSTVHALDLFV